MLQEAGHIKNTVVFIFRHIQCLHLVYSEVAWVLVSSGSQVHPQIMLDPDNLPDYLSVSYDYDMRDSGEVKDLVYFRKYIQNKSVIAHLNINSSGNKFELLTEKKKENADIC